MAKSKDKKAAAPRAKAYELDSLEKEAKAREGSKLPEPKKQTVKTATSKRSITRKEAKVAATTYANRAEKYANDPTKVDRLLKEAQKKAKKNKGPLSGRLEDVSTLMRLVRAYMRREYRDVPWESIALAIGSLIYFVSPADLIPDVIPGIGQIDDAAVFGFVIASIYNDLADFRAWEEARGSAD